MDSKNLVKIAAKGRVYLPKWLREDLNLKADDKLEMTAAGNGMILKKVEAEE